jgi:hypothetical protein
MSSINSGLMMAIHLIAGIPLPYDEDRTTRDRWFNDQELRNRPQRTRNVATAIPADEPAGPEQSDVPANNHDPDVFTDIDGHIWELVDPSIVATWSQPDVMRRTSTVSREYMIDDFGQTWERID